MSVRSVGGLFADDQAFRRMTCWLSQARLMARMASARISDQQAREIIADPEAHRQFIASLCAGMYWAAGKRP